MKKYILSSFTLLLCTVLALAEQGIPTKVNSATIFPNGAEIIRTVKVNLKKGENTIEFLEIEAEINAQSLVVSSDKEVAILTSVHTISTRERKYQSAEHSKILDSLAIYEKQKKSME